MAECKPKRPMTNLAKCRLEAIKRNKVVLSNVYTLGQGTELFGQLMKGLPTNLSEELIQKVCLAFVILLLSIIKTIRAQGTKNCLWAGNDLEFIMQL